MLGVGDGTSGVQGFITYLQLACHAHAWEDWLN